MIQTEYKGLMDRERMLALVRDYPVHQTHVIDLPYRLCSWAFDDNRNIALWEDSDHQLMAWAVLQGPFWAIDLALHPAAPSNALATILAWADMRAMTSLKTDNGRPSWFVFVSSGQSDRFTALEAAGFEAQNIGANAWNQVTLAMDAETDIPECTVKHGYRLREFRGSEEISSIVALHRAVFESRNMTGSWRRRIIDHPAYCSNLDLVVENASGELVAFCLAWVAHLRRQVNGDQRIVGQIEPIGVREDVRRDGIAWPLLFQSIQRMRAAGAHEIIVQTDNFRDRAFSFYHSAGFHIVDRITVFRKDYHTEESYSR